jgi:prepilin-type N-terminal cleavage/methylation domain-containing protein
MRGHEKFTAGQRGFTLVEVVMVVAIIALAAMITLPNLQRVRVKTGTTSALLGVAGTFEAVKRRSPVVLVYDKTDRMLMAFEDWHPLNQDVTTNDNGLHEFVEETVIGRPIPAKLLCTAAPSGDPAALTEIQRVVFRPDGKADLRTHAGALQPGTDMGALYVADRLGNTFRVRVNEFTGAISLEQFLSSKSWTATREAWEWIYK